MSKLIQLLIALTVASVTCHAQVTSATILGTVTDPSGGAVRGAIVSITNVGTNVHSKITSDSDGNFEQPYLQRGRYKVSIEAAGFKTFLETDIVLNVDFKYRVNARLELGTSSQTITVAANAQVLQTDASDLSQTIDERMVKNLPNINNNPLYYATLLSGVVPTGAFMDPNNVNTDDNSRQSFSGFTVNGSRPISSNIQLDGAFNTNGYVNEIAVIPSRDAIAEVKIITNAYSAEYGRAGGGVINFTTKSGENRVHGSLYEDFRNSALNANSFGNNTFGSYSNGKSLRPKPPFSTNAFGGSFSGPIWVPKLYNGHNKSFFFVSYAGLRRFQGASTYYTLPTAAERTGDFSKTVAQVSIAGVTQVVPINIYLPLPSTTTVTQLSGGQYQLVRQQASYNGVANVIHPQFLNPTALKMMSYYPLPNITPLNLDNSSNYFTNAPAYTRTDQLITKLDHNISAMQRVFFRWTTDWTLSNPYNLFATTFPDAANNEPTTQFNPSATFGYNSTLSATDVLELRANVTRINLQTMPIGGIHFDQASLGFAQAQIANLSAPSFPYAAIGSYPNLGANLFRTNHSANMSFTPNYTHLHGKWTSKLGMEYLVLYNNFFQPARGSGNGGYTAAGAGFSQYCGGTGCQAVAANAPQGSSPANFLMGVADGNVGSGQYSRGEQAYSLKNGFWAGYSQNDWKVNNRLTLNLGVRWEFQGPLTERYNRLSQFNPSAYNETGTRGLYEFSGANGVPRGQTSMNWSNFAPRIGFAYRMGQKTVIRSAYGISYDMVTGFGSGGQGFGTDGFSTPLYIQIRPSTGYDILQSPFNNAFSYGTAPAGSNPYNTGLLGASLVTGFIRTGNQTPYVQQWNFAIERELPHGWDLQVAYVGTKGTHLQIQQHPVNQTDDIPQPILTSAINTYLATGANPLTSLVPNPFYGTIKNNTTLNGPNIQQSLLYEPFPAYGGVVIWNDRIANSSYNSLQMTVKHAFQHGFQVMGAYTWSKSIDAGGSYAANVQGGASQGSLFWDPNNLRLDRSVSAFDVPRRLVISYLWALPMGKGQPLLSTTPVLNHLLSGWNLGGVASFADGFPLPVTGTGFGRPNVIADPVLPAKDRIIGDGHTSVTLPTGQTVVPPAGYMLYFNPDAFQASVLTVPRAGTDQTVNVTNPYYYGNAPRLFSNLRSTGINNFDLTLSRTVNLTESARLEIRGQAYNAFNRVQWGAPSTGFGGPNLTTPGSIGMNTSTTFGMINTVTAQTAVSQVSNIPRYLQLSLRLFW